MIVKDIENKGLPGYGELLNVYAVYWVDGKTYFLCSPKRHEGLLAYSEADVEIVDNLLDDKMCLTKSASGSDMILHEALIEDGFLDRLIDDGQGNYQEFVARLGREP